VNEKFFLQDELGLCPKFTTKDSHTSLPKSRSDNIPTNPRNKPQLKATQKRNSRSKGLRQPAKPGADHPHGGRTVREGQADLSQAQGVLSKNSTRTSSIAHRKTDCLCPTRGPSAWKRPSALSSRTVRQTPSNQKDQTKWIEMKRRKNS
jgi:hypothetical protein